MDKGNKIGIAYASLASISSYFGDHSLIFFVGNLILKSRSPGGVGPLSSCWVCLPHHHMSPSNICTKGLGK